MNLNPVMSPVIKNDRGTKIYGHENLNYDMVIENDKAFNDFDKAIKLAPDNAAALNNRGLVYAHMGSYANRTGKPQLRDECYGKAIELCPNESAELYAARAASLDDMHETDRALADYDTAIKIDPNYGTAYNNRGVAHYRKGEYDLAIDDFQRSLSINQNFRDALNNFEAAIAAKGGR